MLKNYFLYIFAFAIVGNSYGQDDDDMGQRFFVGVNVGVKFANKNYAMRYGGWYQQQLEFALTPTGLPSSNYTRIYEMLGQKDFFLDYTGFPTIVRYKPALLTGVTLGYKLSPNLQIGLDANFSKLKVITGYTLQIIDPSSTVSQEQYGTGTITGEESRFNGRFNIDYIIKGGSSINYIVGISGVFSAWRMDQHIAHYESLQMPLFSVHNPTNNLIGPRTRGMGWGFGLSGGVEYRFTPKIVAQLMYQPYVQRADYFNSKNTIANLGTSYVKDGFRLEHDLTVRILWK